MSQENLPDGVGFVMDGDAVVGVTFPKDRALTPEEISQIDDALAEVGLPSLPKPTDDPYLWESGT